MNKSTDSGLTTTGRQTKSKNYKNLIIGVLTVAFFGTLSFYLIEKNRSKKAIEDQQAQIALVTDEKSEIRKSFDESLVRLDSLSEINTKLNMELSDKNKEIASAKSEIRSILNKRNVSVKELGRAKELIASLNEKIFSMEQDMARLTQENQTLSQEKVVLIQEKEKLNQDLIVTTEVKDNLTKKVEIASTLNASNITITPVNVKKNEKEKISSTAKRVDKLVISFDVNNRIAEQGMTDIYVLITGPDGQLISKEELGSGTFVTREEGEKLFTTKVALEIEPATKKLVEFSFKPGTDFIEGNYTIQIYQNGFMIGEGKRELKKGGLFS
ncbi:MAG TPA: hypothetical protein VI548_09745 [Chitinophagaceae bacterium]|nr:hypothetical protein [Chitinophagaceae bacterium]